MATTSFLCHPPASQHETCAREFHAIFGIWYVEYVMRAGMEHTHELQQTHIPETCTASLENHSNFPPQTKFFITTSRSRIIMENRAQFSNVTKVSVQLLSYSSHHQLCIYLVTWISFTSSLGLCNFGREDLFCVWEFNALNFGCVSLFSTN